LSISQSGVTCNSTAGHQQNPLQLGKIKRIVRGWGPHHSIRGNVIGFLSHAPMAGDRMDSLKNNRIQPVSTPPTLQEQTDLLRAYRSGFQAAHVIATGLQLGLFEQLASRPQGVTYQALAQGTGYHAPYVRVWCSTAYHYHLLEVDEIGRYRLAPHMDGLLDDRTNLDSLASLFTNAVGRQGPQMAKYSEYVQSGETGSHAEAYGNNPDRHDPPSSTVAIQRRMWVEQLIPKAPD